MAYSDKTTKDTDYTAYSGPTAKQRYTQLETERLQFLNRARDAAALTIPSLMPPQGYTASTVLPTPYQALGARGVNNLASKLLLALFPPNSPFFRMQVDDFTLEKVTQQPGMRAEVEKALNRVERAVQTEIEQQALRVSAFEALKQLIVAGNALCYLLPQGGMRVFRLDSYVVHRDPVGNILEIYTRELISPAAASKLVDAVEDKSYSEKPADKASDNEDGQESTTTKSIELYTCVRRNGNHWLVYQEVKGQIVPGSRGSYPIDKSPWMPLRWTKIDGDSYGRGYCEEYLGDIKSLDGLYRCIIEAAAVSSKVLFLVNPNGLTNAKEVAKAENGAFRAGRKDDITTVQVEKFADMQIALKAVEELSTRLSFAFLLNSSVQRNGERVTAEEIRFMAGELEDALGGVYSLFSQDFQLVLVQRLLYQMERDKKLPPLPKQLVRPTITTGLEALGRGQDLNKLNTFLQALAPLGPQVIAQYMNVPDYITRIGTSLGMDIDGLVKSADQVAQEQAQAQQQALTQDVITKATPNAVNLVRDQVAPKGQPSNG